MSGSPQTCGRSEDTCVLPAAMRVIASRRGAARFVGFALPYSRLRLAKPAAPSGRPTLPANWVDSPSPARYIPVLSSTEPPAEASLRWKFSTPAMASEPYWAAAPSRSTSTCRSATAGMAEMSGPCDPNDTPLPPCQSTIEERCRRLPLISTSVWSGAKLRSITGRTTVDTPLIGWVLALNDGMMVRSWSFRSPVALADEVGGRQHVDRHRRLGGAARLRARAHDHRLLREARDQAPHLLRRQPQGLDLGRRHPERTAQLFRQRIRPLLDLFLRVVALGLRGGAGRRQRKCRPECYQHQHEAPPRVSRSGFRSCHCRVLDPAFRYDVVQTDRIPRIHPPSAGEHLSHQADRVCQSLPAVPFDSLLSISMKSGLAIPHSRRLLDSCGNCYQF